MAVLAIAVQMPIAHAFCFGSGNAALTRASEVTLTVAAATPWTAARDVQDVERAGQAAGDRGQP